MSSNVITAVVPLEKPQVPQVPANQSSPVVDTLPTKTPEAVPQPITEGTTQPEVPVAATEAAPSEPNPTEPNPIQELIGLANEELATTGKLSTESRQKIAEASGLPPEFVELTYEGMLARQQRTNDTLISAAGGQESYLEMVKWATTAYTADQAQAFNAALKTGDLTKAQAAVVELKARFTEVNGSPKALVAKVVQPQAVPSGAVATQVASAGAPGVQPYASFNDMAEAMKDKRYGRDTAFTTEVYRRAHLTKF